MGRVEKIVHSYEFDPGSEQSRKDAINSAFGHLFATWAGFERSERIKMLCEFNKRLEACNEMLSEYSYSSLKFLTAHSQCALAAALVVFDKLEREGK